MDRATIFVGRESLGGNYTEHYALMVGTHLGSVSYDAANGDHEVFLKGVADRFAETISGSSSPLEVGAFNGFKIDVDLKPVRIENLDDVVIQSLSHKIAQKMEESLRGRALVVDVISSN